MSVTSTAFTTPRSCCPTGCPPTPRRRWTGCSRSTLTPGHPGGRPARPNLSKPTRAYLAALGLDPDDQDDADLVFLHVLAFTKAPLYTAQHGDSLHQQYPRVLLPATEDSLRVSAALGQRVKDLLDDTTPLAAGPLLDRLGALRRDDGAAIDPQAGDAVTVAWGTVRRGAVMPGAGRTERPRGRSRTEQPRQQLPTRWAPG